MVYLFSEMYSNSRNPHNILTSVVVRESVSVDFYICLTICTCVLRSVNRVDAFDSASILLDRLVVTKSFFTIERSIPFNSKKLKGGFSSR